MRVYISRFRHSTAFLKIICELLAKLLSHSTTRRRQGFVSQWLTCLMLHGHEMRVALNAHTQYYADDYAGGVDGQSRRRNGQHTI